MTKKISSAQMRASRLTPMSAFDLAKSKVGATIRAGRVVDGENSATPANEAALAGALRAGVDHRRHRWRYQAFVSARTKQEQIRT
jgi:hypothetical protein